MSRTKLGTRKLNNLKKSRYYLYILKSKYINNFQKAGVLKVWREGWQPCIISSIYFNGFYRSDNI